jgi:hypothetical protein
MDGKAIVQSVIKEIVQPGVQRLMERASLREFTRPTRDPLGDSFRQYYGVGSTENPDAYIHSPYCLTIRRALKRGMVVRIASFTN